MHISMLPTIHEENEEQSSLPQQKFPRNDTSPFPSFWNSHPPRTPREIHTLLRMMDDHYDTNFLSWVTNGSHAPSIGSFFVSILSEMNVTPLQLGSVIQAISSKWSVVETSFLFKVCFECISNHSSYTWTPRDWVPVLLSVTSPATIVQFMGLLLFNISTNEKSQVHPILEVFMEGFGLTQTLSLIHALDRGWIGVVSFNWKLHVLKQWGTQPFQMQKLDATSSLLSPSKKRRASESVLLTPLKKMNRGIS